MSSSRPRDLIGRRNVLKKTVESWRPPLFVTSQGPKSRFFGVMRRFFDLQYASIWLDLAKLLMDIRGTVLDIGCGAQPYRSLLSPGATYLGLDTVDANDHFGYKVPHTVYFKGSRWPAKSHTASTVLCTETLEHILDPSQIFREANRCLIPGGKIILTVPFSARWHYVPYDYWRFTPSGLEHLLKSSNFSNIRVYARGNSVTVACYKFMALILPLSLPQSPSFFKRMVSGILSVPFLPLLFLLWAVAYLSLWAEGGNDCLGYTVVAKSSRHADKK